MTAVRVRPAGSLDWERAAATDELAEPGSARWHRLGGYLTGELGWCLIGEVDTGAGPQVVGYTAVAPGRFYGRDFVDLLVVAPGYRRRGAGRLLLDSAVEHGRSPRVFTSTNESNRPMQTLLAAGGWIVSGILTGLDEGDPEIVFYKNR
jgi:GNAT superfamily N-acetyltransferase